jgi:hypothetical protein
MSRNAAFRFKNSRQIRKMPGEAYNAVAVLSGRLVKFGDQVCD